MKKGKPTVYIMGATGAVGRELIQVLYDESIAFNKLRLFASERSVGKKTETPFGSLSIENTASANYADADIVFFAVGGEWSEKNAKKAMDAGATVIDSSSFFRYKDDVPLIIPEVNAAHLGQASLIANPNCTTAIAAIPLWVIHNAFGLKKVFISSYQAVSGAGNKGIEELRKNTVRTLEGERPECSVFQHNIAFNVIPHIDTVQENLYTKEEMKVTWELRKILAIPALAVSCTAVRIPVFRSHSETVIVETEKKVDITALRTLLQQCTGVLLKDDTARHVYPMPISSSHRHEVEVGRLRHNLIFGAYGVEFFISGDQLLKGAALNAVQISALVIARDFS